MNGTQILKQLAKKATKVDITKLTREDFSSPTLKAKYFRHDNKQLDRLHLPAMTKEVYEPIAQEEFNNPRMDKANLKFETASSYYIRKAQLFVLACDLGVNPKTLDSSNYIWNEDYYIHSNFLINAEIAEDLFRERGIDYKSATANEVYINQDGRRSVVDVKLWNELFNFCYTAIVTRKAMLLQKVSQCLSFLVSVSESSCGFSENITATQANTLRSYIEFFTGLLKDENASEFIKSHNDIEVFADHSDTRSDYINTYRSLMRKFSGCAGDELEQFKTDFTKIEDPYIESLIAKEMDLEDFLSGIYLSNESEEDTEDMYEPIGY